MYKSYKRTGECIKIIYWKEKFHKLINFIYDKFSGPYISGKQE